VNDKRQIQGLVLTASTSLLWGVAAVHMAVGDIIRIINSFKIPYSHYFSRFGVCYIDLFIVLMTFAAIVLLWLRNRTAKIIGHVFFITLSLFCIPVLMLAISYGHGNMSWMVEVLPLLGILLSVLSLALIIKPTRQEFATKVLPCFVIILCTFLLLSFIWSRLLSAVNNRQKDREIDTITFYRQTDSTDNRTVDKWPDAIPYHLVDTKPTVNGGMNLEEFSIWIISQIKLKDEDKISGTVRLRVLLSEDGKIIDIDDLGKADDSPLTEAYIKAVMESPQWTPAIHQGKPCQVKMNIVTHIDYR
jgi:hypothetical protein